MGDHDDPDRFRMAVTFDEQADGKTALTMRQLYPSPERRQAVISVGAVGYPADLLATLQRRELLRVAGQLSEELDLPFAETSGGGRIVGVLRRRVDLVSGRFALIEKSHEFTLVPWRPMLERQIGKPVSGIVRGDGVNWSIGRGRNGPSIT